MIKILLVDDQAAVRRGLQMRLALEPDLCIVGEAGDGAEALQSVGRLHPDVVLMDVEMPRMDGVTATRALRELAPNVAVVFLTLHKDKLRATNGLLAGDVEVVGKDEGEARLLECIRRAAQRGLLRA